MAATQTAVGIRPLHDRVIVQRIEEGEEKVGGIIIPDSAKEKPQSSNTRLPPASTSKALPRLPLPSEAKRMASDRHADRSEAARHAATPSAGVLRDLRRALEQGAEETRRVLRKGARRAFPAAHLS